MLRALPYGVVLLPPLALILASAWGPWGHWAALVLVFGAIPFLDVLLGEATANPSPEELRRPGLAAAHRFWLYLMLPVLWGTTLWGAWVAGTQDLGWSAWVGLVLSLGVCSGGIGITFAHELIHRPHPWDRRLGQLLLLNAAYLHFATEHVFGHHARVATREDPASARRGESLYAFLPRSVWGSWRSAWRLEASFLARRGLGPWHWRNPMLWGLGLPLACAMALGAGWGWLAGLTFLAQAGVGFVLLEAVNYLEHYGLERAWPEGQTRPEPVGIHHSWSTPRRLTNAFLINLQRHSDHHVFGAKPYHELLHLPESPQLPTGYAGMILLALVPPLYFRVMDPRAEAVAKGP